MPAPQGQGQGEGRGKTDKGGDDEKHVSKGLRVLAKEDPSHPSPGQPLGQLAVRLRP